MKTKHEPVKLIQTFTVTNCTECPNVTSERTPHSGFAYDYFCKLTGKKTSGYVEWDSDINPVPEDCPLRVKD